MFSHFSIPFITILLAELLDKSQLSVLLLATKTKRHLELLIGVMAAFIIVDGAAIVFGEFLTTLIPQLWLKYASSILFILFGILSLKSAKDTAKPDGKLSHPFTSGFLLVFLSEWGDKTQLAAALFATKYNPYFVFAGVITALFLLSLAAILASKQITKIINPTVTKRLAGIIFLLLGVTFLLS